MDIMKKRWLILLTACLVNLCIGSLYSWSVFASPMAEYISSAGGNEVPNLSIVFTVANAVGPITMISGGYLNSKLGPKWVLLIGGFIFGGGMIGAGFVKSVAGLLLTYSLGVGLGMGLVYGITVSNTLKFFPDKRGLAGGLTTAFYGGSSILIPPAANQLIQNYHVTTAFRIIGMAALVAICASAFVITPCPAGFKPDGWQPEASSSSGRKRDLSYRQMLKEPVFFVMILTLVCGAFSGLMIISQISLIAQSMIGFSVTQAAGAVSLMAMFNTLGRVLAGTISDRIGSLNTLFITFISSVAGAVLLYVCSTGTSLIFYIGLSLIGFCFGAIMGIYPGLTTEQFGEKYNGINYGIMFIGFALAGVAGPIAMADILSATGKYQLAFLIAAGLSVIGGCLIQVLRFMRRREAGDVSCADG